MVNTAFNDREIPVKTANLKMLHLLIAPPKAIKLPKAALPPKLVVTVGHEPQDKPVNDPTDPNQLLESERNDVGMNPAKRIPVKLGLPRNPIKTQQ